MSAALFQKKTTNKKTDGDKSVKNSASKSDDKNKPKVIADYNGYDYKKIFWEDADRKYEDMADRIAIRRLLPAKMNNFVDIAGGYGRLADEYLNRAKSATLFDYSETELAQAKELYGDRINTKAGDIYSLPFSDEEFDALLMVRATHHFKEMNKVLDELYRVLKPGGTAVIEVANKRTLPKMFRYWFKKSDINPFSYEVAHLKDLNRNGFYNYHPTFMEVEFIRAGFKIEKILSVSNFRSTLLKNILPTKVLTTLEKIVQSPLAKVRFAPSIYYKLKKPKK